MNVTFVKDYMGIHSGWSAYTLGDQATLERGGMWLVKNGYAVDGWDDSASLDDMTKAQLLAYAEQYDIKVSASWTKSKLVEALK